MNRAAGKLMLALFILGIGSASDAAAQAQGGSGGRLLTLQDAIRMTMGRAPETALAVSQVDRAREALREARALNQPQVVAGTGLAYNNGFPLSIEGSAPSAFQIGLNQPMFNQRNKNLIREAEEGINSSTIGQDSMRRDLAARTALVYLEVHHARRLADLWSARFENAGKELKILESMLEAGKTRPLDVTQARISEAAAGQQLLIVQEQARLADLELRQLTGLSLAEQFLTEDAKISLEFSGSPAEAMTDKVLETHPDIRQAESGLRIREFRVAADKSARYPRFEFVTQYALFTHFNNYEDYFRTFKRNNYLVGLSIQVPLFDGSLSSARIAQERLEISEAKLKLERLKSELKLSVERSLSTVKIASGAVQLARRELDAAREGAAVTQALLEGGRLSPRDHLASQSLLREKEVALVEAERLLGQRQVELLRLTGGLSALYE
jgi:outer membrane protein